LSQDPPALSIVVPAYNEERTIHLILDKVRKDKAQEQQRFVRRWVRVELEEDRERELIGRLLLVSGGRRVPVGEFLAPEERKTLAVALKSALAIPHI
jgi:uncharacterized membrane protein